MKIFITISCIAVALVCLACHNESNNTHKGQSSFEIDPQTGDTSNRIINGRKQGKWYLIDSNEWKKGERVIIDTVYFEDDVVIEV